MEARGADVNQATTTVVKAKSRERRRRNGDRFDSGAGGGGGSSLSRMKSYWHIGQRSTSEASRHVGKARQVGRGDCAR